MLIFKINPNEISKNKNKMKIRSTTIKFVSCLLISVQFATIPNSNEWEYIKEFPESNLEWERLKRKELLTPSINKIKKQIHWTFKIFYFNLIIHYIYPAG